MSEASQIDSAETLDMHVDSLLDQGSGAMNEDALFIGDNRFGVFDGAGSLVPFTDKEGRTGGFLAAHIAQETFERSTKSPVDTAREANENIAQAMRDQKIDPTRKEHAWATTMAVVDIDMENRTFEWAQVSDSLILVIMKDGSHKMLTPDGYDHDSTVLSKWKGMAAAGTGDIWTKLQPEIVALRQQANVSYGALNGDLNVTNFIKTGKEILEGVAHILIFTDGMMVPKEDPTAPDNFLLIVEWFKEGGLPLVRDRIRELQNKDPNCLVYPRYKKSDDIGAIAISFK